MQSLQEKLREIGLSIVPAFNVGVVREGAEWFVGREFEVDGRQIQLAWFGDFRDKKRCGEWRSELIEELEPGARERAEVQIKEALQLEKEERTRYHTTVAQEAEKLWEDSTDRGEHPYLVKKKLSSLHGTRIHVNDHGHPVLLIPMRDVSGKLWNITRVFTKDFSDGKGNKRGNKFTLKGGRKEGTMHVLGEIFPKGTLYLCEGFATAASIYEALQNQTVVACFDAGNLLPVARALKEKYPDARFVFCADDDRWKPAYGNAGREKAQEAANAVGGEVRLPHGLKKPHTDFNDLHCTEGLPTVAEQILNPPKAVEPQEERTVSRGQGEGRLVAELIESFGDNLIKQRHDLFEWSDTQGRWVHYDPLQAADRYMRLLDRMSGGRLKFRELQSAFYRFRMEIPHAPEERNLFAPPPLVTNFANGALELLPQPDGTFRLNFREKRKSDLLCYAHPFDYLEDAPLNEEFEETLRRVLPDDAVDTYLEVLGACLIPAFPKVTFLIGPPGSGKSTLILLASHLIHPSLRCSVDPTEFRGFGMETMAGKLVNMDTDITLSRPITESVLKKIEDRAPVRIQRKGITDVYAPLPAMNLFGANALPQTREGVEALARRTLIFKCDKYQAPKSGFIRDYAHHVWTKNPAGIVVRARQGLERLASNRGHFTLFAGTENEMQKWRENTADFVEQFLAALQEGEVEISDSESRASLRQKGEMTRGAWWKMFCAWFEVAAPRRTPPTQTEAYRRLRELGIRDKMRKGVRYFSGFSCQESESGQF